jgi:hypothetical protein
MKNIPKKALAFLLFLGVLWMCSIAQLIILSNTQLDDLQKREIKIDKACVDISLNRTGSRFKLSLISGNTTYYVWYPNSQRQKFSDVIERDLLSGKVTSVTVSISEHSTLRDRLTNRQRIVEVKNNDTVYYDLDTERIRLESDRISAWVLFLISFVAWILDTFLLLSIYRVIKTRKVS